MSSPWTRLQPLEQACSFLLLWDHTLSGSTRSVVTEAVVLCLCFVLGIIHYAFGVACRPLIDSRRIYATHANAFCCQSRWLNVRSPHRRRIYVDDKEVVCLPKMTLGTASTVYEDTINPLGTVIRSHQHPPSFCATLFSLEVVFPPTGAEPANLSTQKRTSFSTAFFSSSEVDG